MLKNILTAGALFISAAAAVCLTAGPALAQRGGGHGGGGHGGGGFHGGGFGGGFHGGGFHGGTFHGGTFHGGVHSGFSNFHPNTFHNFHRFPDHRTFLRSGFGFPFFWGGYYPYYGGYGYYPYDGGATYDLLPYADNYVPFRTGSSSSYYGSYPDQGTMSADSSLATPIPAPKALADSQTEAPAQLTVSVPADAQVWIEGTKTSSTGPVRNFQSPPLDPNSQYRYEVRARWTENGHEVTQTRQVPVTAGARARVDFPMASGQGELISPPRR
jgi:uncharacterized protein (TIGR03000 family)